MNINYIEVDFPQVLSGKLPVAFLSNDDAFYNYDVESKVSSKRIK